MLETSVNIFLIFTHLWKILQNRLAHCIFLGLWTIYYLLRYWVGIEERWMNFRWFFSNFFSPNIIKPDFLACVVIKKEYLTTCYLQVAVYFNTIVPGCKQINYVELISFGSLFFRILFYKCIFPKPNFISDSFKTDKITFFF